MKKTRLLLALAFALCIMIGVFPANAHADEVETSDAPTIVECTLAENPAYLPVSEVVITSTGKSQNINLSRYVKRSAGRITYNCSSELVAIKGSTLVLPSDYIGELDIEYIFPENRKYAEKHLTLHIIVEEYIEDTHANDVEDDGCRVITSKNHNEGKIALSYLRNSNSGLIFCTDGVCIETTKIPEQKTSAFLFRDVRMIQDSYLDITDKFAVSRPEFNVFIMKVSGIFDVINCEQNVVTTSDRLNVYCIGSTAFDILAEAS